MFTDGGCIIAAKDSLLWDVARLDKRLLNSLLNIYRWWLYNNWYRLTLFGGYKTGQKAAQHPPTFVEMEAVYLLLQAYFVRRMQDFLCEDASWTQRLHEYNIYDGRMHNTVLKIFFSHFPNRLIIIRLSNLSLFLRCSPACTSADTEC